MKKSLLALLALLCVVVQVPLEDFFSGSNLKVIFGYAQVHLGISDYGETFIGVYQMTTILHSGILKRELLLVNCGGRQ